MLPENVASQPSPSASSTSDAGSSCPAHGQASRARRTSRRSTGDSSPGLFSSPEVRHVSPQVEPGSRQAREITAGSGRKLSGFLPKSGPLGRCLRILLVSETWASPEYLMKWKASRTKCGCLVFRLVALAPRTGGSDIGLSGDETTAWPSPVSRDAKGQTQNPERMDYVPNVLKASLDTPRDFTMGGNKSRGGDRKDELLLRGQLAASWPTPRSEDSELTGAHRGTPDTLTSAARTAWSTPKSSASGPDFAIADRENSGGHSLPTQAHGPATSGCLARTESFAVRLTTLSAWLMGYTGAFLAHWETASSRRSRRGSSRP